MTKAMMVFLFMRCGFTASLKQKCGISVRRREHKVLNRETRALGLCGSKSSFYLCLVARRAEVEEITGGPRGDDGYGSMGR